MTNSPWLNDACSLVEAFRKKEVSPLEITRASIQACESSDLGAISYLDSEKALDQAEKADIQLPFGGVPIGIKELDTQVNGWPYTQASLVLKENVSTINTTMVTRLRQAGTVLLAQTTASEFGGTNYTSTRLHGTTKNPWDLQRTPGGSSGGSASAVAGGLLPIASGSDGGGSIRIPAGFSGLLGLKATFGRIPRGPLAEINPLSVTLGCLSRSVRDTARWFDVCNGFNSHDPYSLPKVGGWEEGLGSYDLTGKRIAILPDLSGSAVVSSRVKEQIVTATESLIKHSGCEQVDVDVTFPEIVFHWANTAMISVLATLGDRYPACAQDLTPEMEFGLNIMWHSFNAKMAQEAESARRKLNEAMANLFDQVDFVAAAVSPDIAFTAEGPLPTVIDGVDLVNTVGLVNSLANNGALTIPANITGNPAISVPIGTADGLPVGLQIIGKHHEEALLLELALLVEKTHPWPLVSPKVPY
ncbi:MAG: amidase [Actinobacteria bacterium]|nr:amidase [Actinomycetota bacterium]MCL6105631.1 amidase [Actinomycetota bacterium]